jgi:hypothetical protein
MATERDDSLQFVSVRLDGKNYSYWNYVIRNFFKGKKMWGYVSGTYMIPKNIEEGDVVLIDTWEGNNVKIITWINNSIEHSIGTQLAKYETAKEVLDHLQRLFTQSNFAKHYQLENMSSSSEEYEYSRVLFCYDKSLGLIGSYRIGRIKGM